MGSIREFFRRNFARERVEGKELEAIIKALGAEDKVPPVRKGWMAGTLTGKVYRKALSYGTFFDLKLERVDFPVSEEERAKYEQVDAQIDTVTLGYSSTDGNVPLFPEKKRIKGVIRYPAETGDSKPLNLEGADVFDFFERIFLSDEPRSDFEDEGYRANVSYSQRDGETLFNIDLIVPEGGDMVGYNSDTNDRIFSSLDERVIGITAKVPGTPEEYTLW